MKKKLLFVINTLGRAGAETAMVELLRRIDPEEYEIDLYVLLNQGEMVHDLPEYVNLLNENYDDSPVLGEPGRKQLMKYVLRKMFVKGAVISEIPQILYQLCVMLKMRKIQFDKLLWWTMAKSAERFHTEYDLAVSYLEGGAAYYVSEYVLAKKKAAFIHIDYNLAGYSRRLDKECYLKFDHIFAISNEVKTAFSAAYPECISKMSVFPNLLNRKMILEKSLQEGGFSDGFDGFRILTVGRLNKQKAFEYSIDAMEKIKASGRKARWYVLGEGEERSNLQKRINQLHLEEDFLLLGNRENPYPFFSQADLYVHASRFEGKSIAVQEAQILGCAILVTDCNGNREQVIDGGDGEICKLDAKVIAEHILELMDQHDKRMMYKKAAESKMQASGEHVQDLLRMI